MPWLCDHIRKPSSVEMAAAAEGPIDAGVVWLVIARLQRCSCIRGRIGHRRYWLVLGHTIVFHRSAFLVAAVRLSKTSPSASPSTASQSHALNSPSAARMTAYLSGPATARKLPSRTIFMLLLCRRAVRSSSRTAAPYNAVGGQRGCAHSVHLHVMGGIRRLPFRGRVEDLSRRYDGLLRRR